MKIAVISETMVSGTDIHACRFIPITYCTYWLQRRTLVYYVKEGHSRGENTLPLKKPDGIFRTMVFIDGSAVTVTEDGGWWLMCCVIWWRRGGYWLDSLHQREGLDSATGRSCLGGDLKATKPYSKSRSSATFILSRPLTTTHYKQQQWQTSYIQRRLRDPCRSALWFLMVWQMILVPSYNKKILWHSLYPAGTVDTASDTTCVGCDLCLMQWKVIWSINHVIHGKIVPTNRIRHDDTECWSKEKVLYFLAMIPVLL